MAIIQFHVLAPDASAAQLAEAYQRALDILVRHEKLTAGSVVHTPHVVLPSDVIEELEATYLQDRQVSAKDEGAAVQRYDIEVAGARSLNSLAMGLSRILTPRVQLPTDPVALEQQDQFETPALYPWTVEVFR